MKKISSKFYSVDQEKPIAYTVAELIKILKELPPNLPTENTFGEGVMVTVYNFGDDSCCVMFEEPES